MQVSYTLHFKGSTEYIAFLKGNIKKQSLINQFRAKESTVVFQNKFNVLNRWRPTTVSFPLHRKNFYYSLFKH